jgi:hypothetical protein
MQAVYTLYPYLRCNSFSTNATFGKTQVFWDLTIQVVADKQHIQGLIDSVDGVLGSLGDSRVRLCFFIHSYLYPYASLTGRVGLVELGSTFSSPQTVRISGAWPPPAPSQ